MASILQFRRALQFLSDDFPFSQAFGNASTREKCIQSAQTVFERLAEYTADDETLDFETLCLVAKRPDGELDRAKVRELIRLFRPNRSGQLLKIDFVKSVDR
jgi:Ca2+-binding EF-hand superfamily protein